MSNPGLRQLGLIVETLLRHLRESESKVKAKQKRSRVTESTRGVAGVVGGAGGAWGLGGDVQVDVRLAEWVSLSILWGVWSGRLS